MPALNRQAGLNPELRASCCTFSLGSRLPTKPQPPTLTPTLSLIVMLTQPYPHLPGPAGLRRPHRARAQLPPAGANPELRPALTLPQRCHNSRRGHLHRRLIHPAPGHRGLEVGHHRVRPTSTRLAYPPEWRHHQHGRRSECGGSAVVLGQEPTEAGGKEKLQPWAPTSATVFTPAGTSVTDPDANP